MITRQRLGQLIKEETIIYTTKFGGKKAEKFKLRKDFYMSQKDTLCCPNKSQEFLVCEVKFKYLFETKEEAEEYLKYNYITREEKLEVPTWEEFKNQEKQIRFFSYPCNYVCYTDLINIGITEYYGMSGKEIFNKPLTRENYDEARDLCIRLFKGEEI